MSLPHVDDHARAPNVPRIVPYPRHRLAVVLTSTLLARCVLILSTFLLLPPRAWPTHTWAGYVISASTSPLVNALALSVYDQLVKVRGLHCVGACCCTLLPSGKPPTGM